MALIEKYSKKPRFRNFFVSAHRIFCSAAVLLLYLFDSVLLPERFCIAALHLRHSFQELLQRPLRFSPRRLPSVLVLRREPAPESFTSSVVHLSKIKFPKALRTFSKNFYVFFYFCKTIAPVIGFVNTPCRIFFRILQKHIKNQQVCARTPQNRMRGTDLLFSFPNIFYDAWNWLLYRL